MPSNSNKHRRKSITLNRNFLKGIRRNFFAIMRSYRHELKRPTCTLIRKETTTGLVEIKELIKHLISKVQHDQAVAMNTALASLRNP